MKRNDGRNGLEKEGSEEESRKGNGLDETGAAPVPTVEHGPGDSAEAGPQVVPAPEDIEELKRKAGLADEYFGRLQRLQAEFDNYRKRIKREEATLFHRAIEDVVLDLVEVMDLFDRALEEKHASDVPPAYRKGIELVYRVLSDVLERRGLSRIKAHGEPFDPNIHEAVMVEENKEVLNGTVVDEIKPGYLLGERLLRASAVKVSHGGPPQPKSEEKEDTNKASADGRQDTNEKKDP